MGGVFNLLGLLFFLPPETRRLSRETRIGIGFAAAGALAVLLVSQSSKGMDEIRVLMVGDPLFVTHRDVFVVLAVLVPSAFAVALFFRRFLLVAFDREMAVSLGIRARRWDVLFFLVLGLSVAIAIHDAGVLFTIGYLVLPGATALAFARRPWAVFGGAAATGLACSASGFVLGHALDLPLGPTTVALAFAVFLAARVSVRLRARFSPA
jgi:ABC-type Mn2+/Zn2+ transport system permease subunit